MRAFTIATGAYTELAAITVPAFEWATGLVVTVVADVDESFGSEAPYARKLTLPDDEPFVYFDADLLFLRKWEVPEIPLEEFAGVLAKRYERSLQATLARYGGDPRKFFNTGLFIASARHRESFAQAREWLREGVSSLHEESVLNCALQRDGVPLRCLPADVNQQILSNMNARGFHLCTQRGLQRKLDEARFLVRHHAAPELRRLLNERDIVRAIGPRQEAQCA